MQINVNNPNNPHANKKLKKNTEFTISGAFLQKIVYHITSFCKNSTSFPRMFYLIDFADTARNARTFLRRAKLISSVF